MYCEHLFCVFFHLFKFWIKFLSPPSAEEFWNLFYPTLSFNARTKTNTRDEQQLFDDAVYVRFVLDEL